MNLFEKHNLKMTEANDGTKSGSPGNPPAEPAKPAENTPAPEKEGGKKFDNFGYEVPSKEGEEKPGEPAKPAEPPKEKEEVKGELGYGEEPPVAPEGEEAPPAASEQKPDEGLGYELKLEGFDKPDADRIVQVAKELGLSKEQAEKFVASEKAEIDKVKGLIAKEKADVANKIAVRNQAWHKELKEDATFGGENFKRNLFLSEKVVTDFFPELKKVLTDSKQVLPPYIMKGLARVAGELVKVENLAQGEPPAPPPPPKKEVSPLDFYGTVEIKS